MLSGYKFISSLASSTMAPGVDAISEELKIHDPVVSTLLLTVYVLGYAVGPLLLGPASEIYGRKPVLTLSNLWYLVFNIACGLARSRDQMIAFRLLAGVGGSGPLAVSWDILLLGHNPLFLIPHSTARRRSAQRLLECRRADQGAEPVHAPSATVCPHHTML